MTAPLSVDQVLRLNQHHLARFVKDNLSDEGDALNISNIADWEDVSQATRDRLAEQLLTAVQKTVAPSVDPLELATLLARIPSDRGSLSPHTTPQYASSSRSSTVEPTEGDAREYQARCYRALLDDGCRPLFPLSLLPQVSTDTDAYRDMLRPWTEYPDTPSPQDCDVFSRQLRRWKEYRAWQLVNRRQTVGFSEYLDEKRREFERMGASEFTADPVFEQTVHHQWEDEYSRGRPQRDDDNAEAVLFRYAAAASRLLIDHGFVQPFQLQADLKQQDQWTTYVEYLAFECFHLGKLAAFARKLRPQHDAEWEKLVKAGVVKPLDTYDDLASTEAEAMRLRELEKAARTVRSFTAATGTTTTTMAKKASTTNARGKRRGTRRGQKPPTHASKSLQSAQTHLDDITRRNELVDEYLHSTQKYRTAKAEADYQQRRVEWVLSEISKIEAEQKAGKGSSSRETGSRKRKRTTDDIVEARVEKQRRTDETVASGSDNSRTTRSKKRRCPTDEDTFEPQFKTYNMAAGESDGPGTRSRKRPKGTSAASLI